MSKGFNNGNQDIEPKITAKKMKCQILSFCLGFEPLTWYCIVAYLLNAAFSKINLIQIGEYPDYCEGSYLLNI